MIPRSLVVLLLLTIFHSTASADTFTVTLKVVDAEQKPVAHAEAALFWNVKDGAMTARADKQSISDAAGKAQLVVDNWSEKRPVLVLSTDRKFGGIIGVSKADDGKELTVVLGPTVHVKGKLECQELKLRPEWANTIVTRDGFRAYFAQNITKNAEVEFVLPAGKYTFASYGSDVANTKRVATLSSERREHDFGIIDMKATAIARLRGKTLPSWTIADARGAKPEVQPADYKGKWLYLEFWGYW